MVRRFAVVALALAAGACVRSTSSPCAAGRTELDGVCVSDAVADYVACVRAQGARLDRRRADRLSADARAAGVQASAASEVSDTLEKSYSTSDENTLEIIRACKDIRAGQSQASFASAAPASAGRFGAIAISDSSERFGWAIDRPSRALAEDHARLECGTSDCRSVVWFVNSCGAVARGANREPYVGWGFTDRASAESAALSECGRHTQGCALVAWSCTSR